MRIILSAAICPCRSATTQCSTRIRSPEIGWPTGNVAGRADVRRACFHVLVDAHAFVNDKSGLLSKHDARAHADADDDQVGIKRAAAFEYRALAFNCGDAVFEMEFHAVLLM